MKSVASDPEPALATQAAPVPCRSSGDYANTILVADDDPATLRLVEYVLTRAGYDVRLARDGEEAMTILAECKPALLLLDCDMPKLDGLEVCRRIKRDPKFSGVPTIFLTAMSSPADKARGYAAGGDDYIAKPLERSELLNRIRKQLDLARTQAQVHQQAILLNAHAGRLNEARDLQQSLLADVSRFTDLDIALHYQPATEATGDFYEVVSLGPDEYGLLVAEASSAPIRGGFLVGVMKALAATFVNPTLSTQETLVLLNTALTKCLGAHRQVNACYTRLHTTTRQLEIGCAGNINPLLLGANGRYREITACGDPLGAREDASFATQFLSAESGDRLFLFTTGLVGTEGHTTGGLGTLRHMLQAHHREPLIQTVAQAAAALQPTPDIISLRDQLLLALEC